MLINSKVVPARINGLGPFGKKKIQLVGSQLPDFLKETRGLGRERL